MSDTNELFLVSWDCTGLETCINVSKYEKAEMWAKLSDTEPPVSIGNAVQHLMARARANPQRHYEIYTFNVATGITEEDIREMFDNAPQTAADLIRDRGRKIYSDRVRQSEVKIV